MYPSPRSKRELSLIKRNPFGDTDGDGVPNFFDCKPLNRKFQGKFTQNIPISEAKRLTLYHGTPPENTQQILKEGLDPKKISEATKDFGKKYQAAKLKQGVFVTPYISYAHAYTKEGSGPIFKFTIDKENAKDIYTKIHGTGGLEPNTEMIISEKIPSNQLSVVSRKYIEKHSRPIWSDEGFSSDLLASKDLYDRMEARNNAHLEEQPESLQELDVNIEPIQVEEEKDED